MRKFLFALILTLILQQIVYAASTRFDRALDFYFKNNYKQAIYLFEREVKANYRNYDAHYYLGILYRDQNEKQKALKHLKKIPMISKRYRDAQDVIFMIERPEEFKSMHEIEHEKAKENLKEDNYYDYMRKPYVVWNKFPLKVYIEPSARYSWVNEAFRGWQKATKGFISFIMISTKPHADIVVSTSRENEATDGGYNLGYARFIPRADGKIKQVEIVIRKINPNSKATYIKTDLINVLQHEIGHAIGLGHSPSCSDIMGTHCYSRSTSSISPRDLKTLNMVYKNVKIKR
ncbi:MAG: matrixin family metalloprotease [Cyanobacteria bacterium SIG30]|nr:matrixin family metalloprotease [Cyanobacteria bacterium SIG30]